MTENRHKPRRPPVQPTGSEQTIRQLHEALQECYAAIKQIRAAEASIRQTADTAISDLKALRGQIREDMSPEAIKARIESIVECMAEKIVEICDIAKEVIDEKKEELADQAARLTGAKSSGDLVQAIADIIALDVMAAIREIDQDRRAEKSALKDLAVIYPDIIGALAPKPPPVPPKAKKPPTRRHTHRRTK